MLRVVRAVSAALLLILAASAWAADAPPLAGNWKFIIEQENRPFWLLKLEEKDGVWTGTSTAAEGVFPAKLQDVKVGKEVLHFTLASEKGKFACEVKLPTKLGDKLLGTAQIKTNFIPIRIERTTLAALDAYELNKEIVQRPVGDPLVVEAAMGLLSSAADKKAKPEEVSAWAEKAVKTAELYGPRWHREMVLQVAQVLSEQEPFAALAVTYAQQSEKLLDPKAKASEQKRVLDVLAAALDKSGKKDDAKVIQEKIKKLDFSLKPEPFAGRKGKSDRVVLVELFTGAQCPPCVAADMAFDATGKSYKPDEVILLQYHLHIPGPDPLTNAATISRSRFYGAVIRGTPTVLFNGLPGAPAGGGADDAEEKYEEFNQVIAPLLEKPAGAKIKLTATKKDNKIDISAEASEASKSGDDVRLRLVLVEEAVSYTGGNKLPEHHHVVRDFPGGSEGTQVKDKSAKKTVTVDLDELRKTTTEYLDKYSEKTPFPNKDRPLELKKLKVVAFVQDDESGEVLQAVQVDVK